ncbi:hypothetical protein TorRG33x02_105470 [Trema orientale]|uniref:Uncharacterized protein n=1 Tax=Trema orientale TaxID=63057 RepID=A0A2P5F6Y5_TREOI|nr:hypothetical protein TorRG33x02_105470 [Trema orientale]
MVDSFLANLDELVNNGDAGNMEEDVDGDLRKIMPSGDTRICHVMEPNGATCLLLMLPSHHCKKIQIGATTDDMSSSLLSESSHYGGVHC